jgi:hypothetical protein
MGTADHYRILAVKMRAHAERERHSALRVEWEQLALCYIRLAEQAERNSHTDIVYEPPPFPAAGWRAAAVVSGCVAAPQPALFRGC